MSKWNNVTDEDINTALSKLPEYTGKDNDDLNDYILSNYPFEIPDDDDEAANKDVWNEFYAEGSPFNKWENSIYDKIGQVAEDTDGDNVADNVALVDNDSDPEPDVAVIKWNPKMENEPHTEHYEEIKQAIEDYYKTHKKMPNVEDYKIILDSIKGPHGSNNSSDDTYNETYEVASDMDSTGTLSASDYDKNDHSSSDWDDVINTLSDLY